MSGSLVPFRWNMGNPRLSRRLGPGASLQPPKGFKETLTQLAVEVLRAGQDVDFVFVGRSPENLYDFLSGALAETSWFGRTQQLQLSLHEHAPGRLRRQHAAALARLWGYFESLGLTPPQLLERPRPVAFVDLVFAGRTFGNLLRLLRFWSGGDLRRWGPVRDRLILVCIVERGHSRFEPWEPGHSPWTGEVAEGALRRVPLDTKTWRYWADRQPKTTDSFPPDRWDDPEQGEPPTERERLQAARFARSLYRLGGWSRRRLATSLAGRRGESIPVWRDRLARELAPLGKRRRRGR